MRQAYALLVAFLILGGMLLIDAPKAEAATCASATEFYPSSLVTNGGSDSGSTEVPGTSTGTFQFTLSIPSTICSGSYLFYTVGFYGIVCDNGVEGGSGTISETTSFTDSRSLTYQSGPSIGTIYGCDASSPGIQGESMTFVYTNYAVVPTEESDALTLNFSISATGDWSGGLNWEASAEAFAYVASGVNAANPIDPVICPGPESGPLDCQIENWSVSSPVSLNWFFSGDYTEIPLAMENQDITGSISGATALGASSILSMQYLTVGKYGSSISGSIDQGGSSYVGQTFAIMGSPVNASVAFTACNFFQTQCWWEPILFYGMYVGLWIGIGASMQVKARSMTYLFGAAVSYASIYLVLLGELPYPFAMLAFIGAFVYGLRLDGVF